MGLSVKLSWARWPGRGLMASAGRQLHRMEPQASRRLHLTAILRSKSKALLTLGGKDDQDEADVRSAGSARRSSLGRRDGGALAPSARLLSPRRDRLARSLGKGRARARVSRRAGG